MGRLPYGDGEGMIDEQPVCCQEPKALDLGLCEEQFVEWVLVAQRYFQRLCCMILGDREEADVLIPKRLQDTLRVEGLFLAPLGCRLPYLSRISQIDRADDDVRIALLEELAFRAREQRPRNHQRIEIRRVNEDTHPSCRLG